MVVIRPSTMVNSSFKTLAKGAKQFVVQEAFDRTLMSLEYLSKLTPTTNIGASAEGAELFHKSGKGKGIDGISRVTNMMTFLAPPFKCALAFSVVVKTPVDSTM
jgi:hypothetical protein